MSLDNIENGNYSENLHNINYMTDVISHVELYDRYDMSSKTV